MASTIQIDHIAKPQYVIEYANDLRELRIQLHEERRQGDESKDPRLSIPPWEVSGRISEACGRNYVFIVWQARDTPARKIIGMATLVIAHTIDEGHHGMIKDFVIHRDHQTPELIRELIRTIQRKAEHLQMLAIMSAPYTRAHREAYTDLGFNAYDEVNMRFIIQEPLRPSSTKE